MVAAILILQVVRGAQSWALILKLANYCIALLITSIPVGLNAVVETGLAVGSNRLSKAHGVIVSKLSVLIDLASLNVLCADKTGTLTKNELSLQEPWLLPGQQVTQEEFFLYAALAGDYTAAQQDAIDRTITARVPQRLLAEWEQIDFVPFEPGNKRTESTVVRRGEEEKTMRLVKGSPQILLQMANFGESVARQVEAQVESLAKGGYRSIGVARIDCENDCEFLGIVSLFDPLRNDTLATVRACQHLGIDLKMISGDHHAICQETARQLGMTGEILSPDFFERVSLMSKEDVRAQINATSGFAQVDPIQKHFVVESLQGDASIVAMTGDGVNDCPALKKSDIGIAVEGASDAARAAADLVLRTPGLSAIVAAVLRSRKLFQRIRNYLLFRISISISIMLCSLLLIVLHDFSLPPLALVVLVIALDVAALATAKDKVSPSRSPSQWRIKQLIAMAVLLGIVGAMEGCAAYWIGASGGLFFSSDLSDSELSALVYLALSFGSQLSVFVCRTESSFFTRRPGWSLLITVALGCATGLAIGLFAEFEGFSSLIWKDAGCVLVLCVLFFLLKDLLKVFALQGFQYMEKKNQEDELFFSQNRKLLESIVVEQ